jgi:hypothetical protein
MTKIEMTVRQVSDLRNFYIRLQRLKKAGSCAQDQPVCPPTLTDGPSPQAAHEVPVNQKRPQTGHSGDLRS